MRWVPRRAHGARCRWWCQQPGALTVASLPIARWGGVWHTLQGMLCPPCVLSCQLAGLRQRSHAACLFCSAATPLPPTTHAPFHLYRPCPSTPGTRLPPLKRCLQPSTATAPRSCAPGMRSVCHGPSMPRSRCALQPGLLQPRPACLWLWLRPQFAWAAHRARLSSCTDSGQLLIALGYHLLPCPAALPQARWRRYLYLFPLDPDNDSSPAGSNGLQQQGDAQAHFPAGGVAAAGVDAARVHSLLQALVGADLDCTAIARDTPAGKGCVCRLLVARAWRAQLPTGGHAGQPSIGIRGACRMCDGWCSTSWQHGWGALVLSLAAACRPTAVPLHLPRQLLECLLQPSC